MTSFKSVPSTTTLFIVIAIVVFLFSCKEGNFKDKLNNDLKELDLNGKVKTLTQTQSYAEDKFGEIQKTGIIVKHIYSFNEDGNILEHSYAEADGSISTGIVNNYDKNGKLKELDTYINKFCVAKNIYEYDNNGYDMGNALYDSTDTFRGRIIKVYDEKGNLKEIKHLKQDNTLEYKFLYKYDELGNNIEVVGYNPDGSTMDKETYEYDEKGNKIKSVLYIENKISEIQEFKFDSKNRLIKECYSKGCKINIVNYKYDKIDKSGNWLLKLQDGQHSDDISRFTIIEREIQYY